MNKSEQDERAFNRAIEILTASAGTLLLATSFGVVSDSLGNLESVRLCKTLTQELIPECLESIYPE